MTRRVVVDPLASSRLVRVTVPSAELLECVLTLRGVDEIGDCCQGRAIFLFSLILKIGPVRLLALVLPVLDSDGDRDRLGLPKDAID